jgi:hypothetical protein
MVWFAVTATAVLAMLGPLGSVPPAAAQTDEPDEQAEQELAARYAPRLMVTAPDGTCTSGDRPVAPLAAEAVLDNPQVALRQVGENDPVVKVGPDASDIFELGEGLYLDFPGSSLSPGCIYRQDFERFTDGEPSVVYAHVATQADRPDQLALQYWFFWYFNDWNNKHEGDWEGIQLLFDAATAEEALETEPVSVGYSRHHGGEEYGWESDELERVDTHPVVYPSNGSNGSYFAAELFLGRSGAEGFGCDDTSGPHAAVDPDVVVLPDKVDDPADPLAWLMFEGRWGERQDGSFNAPHGPIGADRWDEPITWHENLHSTSVVIPTGGGEGPLGLVTLFCEVVEWGAGKLILLMEQPVLVIAIGGVVFLALLWLARRTDWSAVQPLPIRRRRRLGQIVKAAWRLYRAKFRSFVEIGLVYIPVALITGLAVTLVGYLPFIGPLFSTDRDVGVAEVFVSLIAGNVSHAFAFVAVVATVAVFLDGQDGGDSDEPMTARDAIAQTIANGRAIASGLLRATVIVGLLLISFVGIPWGIRQLIRYQFIAPVTVLEGRVGGAALDRSSDLVRGRWLHTAIAIGGVNAGVGLVGAVAGLLFLIISAGLPLWLFAVLVNTASAIVSPFAAIAAVLLYGDAVAEENDLEPAPDIEMVDA